MAPSLDASVQVGRVSLLSALPALAPSPSRFRQVRCAPATSPKLGLFISPFPGLCHISLRAPSLLYAFSLILSLLSPPFLLLLRFLCPALCTQSGVLFHVFPPPVSPCRSSGSQGTQIFLEMTRRTNLPKVAPLHPLQLLSVCLL